MAIFKISKRGIWIYSLLTSLILINYTIFFRELLLGWFPLENLRDYTYTIKNQEFKVEEGYFPVGFYLIKSVTYYDDVIRSHAIYVHCHPTHSDLMLYRTFRMRPWHFWNWFNYFTHPRWDIPYLNPKDLQPLPKNPTPSICSE
jgi:hypothetical protein